MSVDERNRLQLAEAAKRVLGTDEGITLMELLAPVGWADVATKHDLLVLEDRFDARFDSFEGRVDARFESFGFRLENLESRMEARFERGFRQVVVTTASLMVTGFVAIIGALVAVIKL